MGGGRTGGCRRCGCNRLFPRVIAQRRVLGEYLFHLLNVVFYPGDDAFDNQALDHGINGADKNNGNFGDHARIGSVIPQSQERATHHRSEFITVLDCSGDGGLHDDLGSLVYLYDTLYVGCLGLAHGGLGEECFLGGHAWA